MKSTLRLGGIVLICITCDVKTQKKTCFSKFQLFFSYISVCSVYLFRDVQTVSIINSAHGNDLIGNDKLLSLFTSTRQLFLELIRF